MILASGCFDGLHSGHARYLCAATRLARYQQDGGTREDVQVAVAPDAYIRTQKHRRPRWTQADRVEAVAAMRYVVMAIAQNEPTPAALIRSLTPRLFVKGADWCGKLPQDVIDACREVDCQIVYVDTPGRHVSEARG